MEKNLILHGVIVGSVRQMLSYSVGICCISKISKY